MTLAELCKEVLELDAKATKGPWNWEDWNEDYGPNLQTLVAPPETRDGGRSQMFPELGNDLLRCEDPPSESTRELIAHYRTAAVKLALAAQRMEKRINDFCDCRGFSNSSCSFCEVLADVQKIVGGE